MTIRAIAVMFCPALRVLSGGKGQMLLLIPLLGTVGMEYIKPEYFQFKKQHGIVPVWECDNVPVTLLIWLSQARLSVVCLHRQFCL